MKGPFVSLHARTFCHATEDIGKVRLALENIIGEADIAVTKSEGHHGNPITVLEARIDDPDGIAAFFRRLSKVDIQAVERDLSSRIDDSCDLFVRLDKQSAYEGDVKLAHNADVVSVRVRVRAFPSKPAIACEAVKSYLQAESSGRESER